MPKLYNVGADPAVVDNALPAIPPGGAYEFTDEQVAAGITGTWSEKNPRSGLDAERAFKQKRDQNINPAQPDNKE